MYSEIGLEKFKVMWSIIVQIIGDSICLVMGDCYYEGIGFWCYQDFEFLSQKSMFLIKVL